MSRIDVVYGVQGRLRFCRPTVRLKNGEVRNIHLAGKKVEYNHIHDKGGTTQVWRLKVG